MNTVRIRWYGHSCFEIRTDTGSVVLDPYEDGSVPGLTLPGNITADAVFCSHEHADHSAAHLIHLSGKENPLSVSYITVPHDHHDGAKRGMTRITFLKVNGILIAHLGDLGRLPTKEEYEKLSEADVVMLPCAGYFTISSSEAEEIIRHLKKPSLKILMHFRDEKRGYEVQEDIRDVVKNISGVKRIDKTDVDINPDSIPDEVITLRSAQK